PSMIWQTYSWDFETHGSYFGAMKACEPVHVQMNLHDNKVIAVNSTLQSYQSVNLIFSVIDLNGKILFTTTKKTDLLQNSKTELFTPDLVGINLPQVYMVRLQLNALDGKVLSTNEYWKSNKETGNFLAFNKLSNVSLNIYKTGLNNGNTVLSIENKSNTPVVGLKLNLTDLKNNIILPAYFSDGYFTLMPSEKRLIDVRYSGNMDNLKVRTEAYNSLPTFHPIN
ncbi:MAG: hypothetical protein RIT11_173, partial [Pseudomonadota bacterium]